MSKKKKKKTTSKRAVKKSTKRKAASKRKVKKVSKKSKKKVVKMKIAKRKSGRKTAKRKVVKRKVKKKVIKKKISKKKVPKKISKKVRSKQSKRKVLKSLVKTKVKKPLVVAVQPSAVEELSLVKRRSRAKKKVGLSKDEILAKVTEDVYGDNTANVQELVEKGREQGFITQREIMQTLPKIEEDIELLDDFYSLLNEAGIEMVESEESLKDVVAPGEEELLESAAKYQAEAKDEGLQDVSRDSVRL
ncbi:RNA polymerase sigma factor region1.1 domain-containing protein, partial [Patescibacteria group bacterium]|nr:RNA polymerase sigma factor region1.1 domain-containing protein [Patescibacteria group bacterium]